MLRMLILDAEGGPLTTSDGPTPSKMAIRQFPCRGTPGQSYVEK